MSNGTDISKWPTVADLKRRWGISQGAVNTLRLDRKIQAVLWNAPGMGRPGWRFTPDSVERWDSEWRPAKNADLATARETVAKGFLPDSKTIGGSAR
jgi:hypothetical protein